VISERESENVNVNKKLTSHEKQSPGDKCAPLCVTLFIAIMTCSHGMRAEGKTHHTISAKTIRRQANVLLWWWRRRRRLLFFLVLQVFGQIRIHRQCNSILLQQLLSECQLESLQMRAVDIRCKPTEPNASDDSAKEMFRMTNRARVCRYKPCYT
jgi:hypothetical protein